MFHLKSTIIAAVLFVVGFTIGRFFADTPRVYAQAVSNQTRQAGWPGFGDVLYTSSSDGKTVYVWRLGQADRRDGSFDEEALDYSTYPKFLGEFQAVKKNQPLPQRGHR
jgi:hypothetical protein